MKTFEPMTAEVADRIQSLIDEPTPMTAERLEVLFNDSDLLSQEETVAGLTHVFRIAKAALAMAAEEPRYEMSEDEGVADYVCTYCGWGSEASGPTHADDCAWFILSQTIGRAI